MSISTLVSFFQPLHFFLDHLNPVELFSRLRFVEGLFLRVFSFERILY
jgi:hypothetical protein